MLRRLVSFLAERPADDPLLAAATWSIVPHVNPDGEARNAAWSASTVPAIDHLGGEDRVYDLPALYASRPCASCRGTTWSSDSRAIRKTAEARPENRAVAAFLAEGAPFHLHASFHGMGFATGPWFLIEEAWIDRTAALRDSMRRIRCGRWDTSSSTSTAAERKVFIASTRGSPPAPIRRSMVRWFEERERSRDGREVPSQLDGVRPLAGRRSLHHGLRDAALPAAAGSWGDGRPDDPHFRAFLARIAGKAPEEVRAEMEKSGVRGMPIRDQMRLQLAFLNAALVAVGNG